MTTASDTAARTTVDAATPSLRPLSYSAPLDGLRAIAVLAVFVFHNNESRLPGGFLGVDLFFVLSGYLITRLLIVENEGSGTVDLAAFWARRFRRLLPASLSVLVTVTLYVSVYGSPTELLARRGDVLWSLFYVANWRFIITDADYFSSDAETSPLRHMWSLAVEEQFYFVWPLLVALILLLTWRWAGLRVLLAVTVVLAVLSAVRMGLLYDAFSPSRAYFGTDARIHQMLVGAAIGMLQARGVLRLVRWPALVQGVMLGAVIAAMFLVAGSDRLYYGLGSFIFALIVGILIASLVDRPDSTVGRGLTWSPIKGLGGISYAFYLWHWPIIIWIAYPVGADFAERRLVDAIRFGLVLLLAAASLRFLEDPVRRGRLPFVGSHSWRSIGAAAVAMAVVGWLAVTMLTPGLDDAVAVAATDQSVEYCPDQPAPCVVSDAGGDAPVVVTMGDSTSQHLTPALVELAEQKKFTLIQSGLGGCSLDDRALAGGSGDNRFRPIDKRCRDALRADHGSGHCSRS